MPSTASDSFDEEDDAALVRACLAGARGAFERLIERHRRVVHHAVRVVISRAGARPDPELCDEAFHRAFSALAEGDMRSLRSWRGDAKLSTFLVVIARRAALRVLQERRGAVPSDATASGRLTRIDDAEGPAHEPPDPGQGPAERAQDAEERRLLRTELGSLAPRDALVLRLFYDEGLKHREIGTVLGVPTTHVGQILSRAREKLRARLEKVGLLPGEERPSPAPPAEGSPARR